MPLTDWSNQKEIGKKVPFSSWNKLNAKRRKSRETTDFVRHFSILIHENKLFCQIQCWASPAQWICQSLDYWKRHLFGTFWYTEIKTDFFLISIIASDCHAYAKNRMICNYLQIIRFFNLRHNFFPCSLLFWIFPKPFVTRNFCPPFCFLVFWHNDRHVFPSTATTLLHLQIHAGAFDRANAT